MSMPRPLVPLLILLLGAPALTAEGVAAPSVFVDTDPVGARLAVDGVVQPEGTPVLLRGLAPGNHRLAVWKDGYRTTYRTVEVTAGAVAAVELSLPPESALLSFPQTAVVRDGLGTMEAEGRQFRVPTGSYSLTTEDGGLQLTPAFPDEGLRVAAGWGLGLLATASVASAASDVWHVSTGWSYSPTMVTAGLLAATLLELPWYLAIEGRKARFLREASGKSLLAAEFPPLASGLSTQADQALESGDLAAAEAALTQLVTGAPESRLVGSAWFRLARIHAVTGRRSLALGEYRLVADTYPQPETFDRSRKALADLLEAEGRPAEALAQLEQMTGSGDLFDPADLETQKTRLQAAVEAAHAE